MATYCRVHDLENCWFAHSREDDARNACQCDADVTCDACLSIDEDDLAAMEDRCMDPNCICNEDASDDDMAAMILADAPDAASAMDPMGFVIDDNGYRVILDCAHNAEISRVADAEIDAWREIIDNARKPRASRNLNSIKKG